MPRPIRAKALMYSQPYNNTTTNKYRNNSNTQEQRKRQTTSHRQQQHTRPPCTTPILFAFLFSCVVSTYECSTSHQEHVCCCQLVLHFLSEQCNLIVISGSHRLGVWLRLGVRQQLHGIEVEPLSHRRVLTGLLGDLLSDDAAEQSSERGKLSSVIQSHLTNDVEVEFIGHDCLSLLHRLVLCNDLLSECDHLIGVGLGVKGGEAASLGVELPDSIASNMKNRITTELKTRKKKREEEKREKKETDKVR